jgi:hypothetical protein
MHGFILPNQALNSLHYPDMLHCSCTFTNCFMLNKAIRNGICLPSNVLIIKIIVESHTPPLLGEGRASLLLGRLPEEACFPHSRSLDEG